MYAKKTELIAFQAIMESKIKNILHEITYLRTYKKENEVSQQDLNAHKSIMESKIKNILIQINQLKNDIANMG